jgi:hypothetical protein
MELVERYLQAVQFWLPKRQQKDILAELSDDLRSQVEEKQAELGRTLNEPEVEAILKRCGHPMLAGSRYMPQQYLIGPALFPTYWLLLKIMFLWILVPVFVLIIGPIVFLASTHQSLLLLGNLWGSLDHSGCCLLHHHFALCDPREVSGQNPFVRQLESG